MGNIYDGAFRTILNDCRQMIIPVINEIFGEGYTGNEKIEFHPNEHFIDQQDEAGQERITDTNFIIYGKRKKKYHLECESSLPDGLMTIRLFEYDAQIVLDEGEVIHETLTVTFPNTAVLYLRNYKKTPDKILLIPFYIFSHEKDFKVYNSNKQRLAELRAEYQDILRRLEKLEQEGMIGAFYKRTIIELSRDVIKEIAKKYENVQKGIGEMMSGALIETEARTILNKGKAEGRNETKKETSLRMLQDGELPFDKIAKYSGLQLAEVELLAGFQKYSGVK